MKIVALTLFLILNSACSLSFGKATLVHDSAKKAVENQNNSNLTKSAVESKSNSNKTGTYRYKSGSFINAIGIEELGDNRLKVVLGANYEYKIDGDWLANSGSAEGVVTLNGNKAILVPEGFESCQIKMDFSVANKINVHQSGTDSDCGFGSSVNAGGIYVKTSDDPNQVEADEMPPGQRINFERGKTSATVSGYVEQNKEVFYSFGARAEQTIKVEITDTSDISDVVFYLVAPDGSRPMGSEDGGGYDSIWTGKLTQTGDYRIVVTTIESAKANFKMAVSIR